MRLRLQTPTRVAALGIVVATVVYSTVVGVTTGQLPAVLLGWAVVGAYVGVTRPFHEDVPGLGVRGSLSLQAACIGTVLLASTAIGTAVTKAPVGTEAFYATAVAAILATATVLCSTTIGLTSTDPVSRSAKIQALKWSIVATVGGILVLAVTTSPEVVLSQNAVVDTVDTITAGSRSFSERSVFHELAVSSIHVAVIARVIPYVARLDGYRTVCVSVFDSFLAPLLDRIGHSLRRREDIDHDEEPDPFSVTVLDARDRTVTALFRLTRLLSVVAGVVSLLSFVAAFTTESVVVFEYVSRRVGETAFTVIDNTGPVSRAIQYGLGTLVALRVSDPVVSTVIGVNWQLNRGRAAASLLPVGLSLGSVVVAEDVIDTLIARKSIHFVVRVDHGIPIYTDSNLTVSVPSDLAGVRLVQSSERFVYALTSFTDTFGDPTVVAALLCTPLLVGTLLVSLHLSVIAPLVERISPLPTVGGWVTLGTVLAAAVADAPSLVVYLGIVVVVLFWEFDQVAVVLPTGFDEAANTARGESVRIVITVALLLLSVVFALGSESLVVAIGFPSQPAGHIRSILVGCVITTGCSLLYMAVRDA